MTEPKLSSSWDASFACAIIAVLISAIVLSTIPRIAPCPSCEGIGSVVEYGPGSTVKSWPCSYCRGTGRDTLYDRWEYLKMQDPIGFPEVTMLFDTEAAGAMLHRQLMTKSISAETRADLSPPVRSLPTAARRAVSPPRAGGGRSGG
jgi:hypothetical protein